MGVSMYKLLLTRRASQFIFGLALAGFLLISFAENSNAQNRPEIPWLSLTGEHDSYNRDWYPDGRIWVPPSTANSPREFLMPIFIENKWYTYPQNADRYQATPIKSFEFKILYDSSSLRAIGVQTFHPYTREEGTDGNRMDNRFKPWYEPLAKDFNFSTWDEVDHSYRKYLNPAVPAEDFSKGRAFRIVGTSSTPLPNTALDRRQYRVLLYVVFRVIPKNTPGVPAVSQSERNSPIFIDHRVIKYNDLNVRVDAPFKDRRKFDPLTVGEYPDPSSWTKPGDAVTGIGGVRNDDIPAIYTIEPHLPGTVYIRVMDNNPEFGFELARGIGSIPAIVNPQPGQWELVDPITVDNTQIDPIVGSRTIQVRNTVSTSRMQDITIESDQEWLSFRTVRVGTNSKQPIPQFTRKGFINFIDNGIIGDPAIRDPRGSETMTSDPEVHLELRCDPAKLNKSNPNDPEKEGVYVGYITFKSPYAGVNPVKMRVTFIYFKTPVEAYRVGTVPGIKLNVTNTDKSAPDGVGHKKTLIFGTGSRATDGVDLLFGEYAYEYAMPSNQFDARFFPVDPNLQGQIPYGFGDLAANDEFGRSNSRDIRDYDNVKKSHVFLVKFNPNNGYPVVLNWNVNDFYPGSSAFIHDTRNGEFFPAVNMREATNLGNGNYSYTIFDARVTQFMIEYTLPTVVDYVNNLGEPIIKKGWNLLSMPVRPVNNYYKNFYVNAINKPFVFTQNQYQAEEHLRPGIGYFIKYEDMVDTRFPGTFIYEIDKDAAPFDGVRLYPGWNTIGTVSVPINISEIFFSDFNGQMPDRSYTRQYGIWAYETNGGYIEVSDLRPGLGYWIKVNNSGFLKLNVPFHLRKEVAMSGAEETSLRNSIINNSTVINVMDNSDKAGKVYITNDLNANTDAFELPPAPPADLFDTRFVDGKYLSNSNESIVRIQGAEYPLTVSLNNANANYTIIDPITNEVFGTINAGTNSTVTINSTSFNAFKIVKSDVATELALSVGPNPVSNISTVKFASTQNELVEVKLYDALGNEMMTILSDVLPAGNYQATLNASTLPSGNYIIKLTAGTRIETVKLNVVR